MDTDVVRETWIVDKLETAHGEGEVGKLIMDLLPALGRNGILNGVWNYVSSVGVGNAPFFCPGDQTSASWGSLASVLVDIQLVCVVTELDEGIDLPWGNDKIAILARAAMSISFRAWVRAIFGSLSISATLVRIPFPRGNLKILKLLLNYFILLMMSSLFLQV